MGFGNNRDDVCFMGFSNNRIDVYTFPYDNAIIFSSSSFMEFVFASLNRDSGFITSQIVEMLVDILTH